MNNLKYFIQYIVIIFLLSIFRLLGIKYARILSGKIFTFIGPLFRSNRLSHKNLLKADFNSCKNIMDFQIRMKDSILNNYKISDFNTDKLYITVNGYHNKEMKTLLDFCKTQGVKASKCTHWSNGSDGTVELAKNVVAICEDNQDTFKYLYEDKSTRQNILKSFPNELSVPRLHQQKSQNHQKQ